MGTTTCLIVGALPSAQFLAWRLYSSDSVIILVGPYVSSDGLIAWKSTKLGANFYTPLIFAREVSELPEKINSFREKDLMTTIDAMIISAVSLTKLEESCRHLAELSSKDTVVLVVADYGVELEETALKYFHNKCRCVLSVLCNMECRLLSLGSYALVNDDDCQVSIGLSYNLMSERSNELVVNAARAEEELSNPDISIVCQLTSQLKQTLWIDVQIQYDLSVKIWEFLLPKISLIIPSIIYEELDYDKLLKDESIQTICGILIKEVYEVCKTQSKQKINKFIDSKNDENLDFQAILDYEKKQNLLLTNNTATEYPEYLSLPFEAYCFYHRFEYPAHILLFQPIKLAKLYNLSYTSLNFLYSIYTKLLSLCGLSVLGGRVESGSLMFLDNKLKLAPNGLDCGRTSKPLRNISRKKNKKSKARTKKEKLSKVGAKEQTHVSKIAQQKVELNSADDPNILPPDLENMYLDAQDFNFYSPKSPNNQLDYSIQTGLKENSNKVRDIDTELLSEIDNSTETDDIEDDSESSNEAVYREEELDKLNNQNLNRNQTNGKDIEFTNKLVPLLCKRCAKEITKGEEVLSDDFDDLFFSEDDEEGLEMDTISILENPLQKRSRRSSKTLNKIVGGIIPQYLKNISTKSDGSKGLSFDKTTQLNLALQLRQSNVFTTSREYDSLIENTQSGQDQEDPGKLKAYNQAKRKLWQMQRDFNIYRGTVTIPRTTPYDEMLQQIEVLNRANTGNIINLTTSRYGSADTYYNFQKERHKLTHILKRAHFKFRTLQIEEPE